MKHLPNLLTFMRLAFVPLFVVLMIDPSRTMIYAATAVFILAALTDFLDGMLARHYKVISDMGKLLDPVADKLLVMAALVMLVAQRSALNAEPWVPGWMVVLVLAREIWVTGLRAIAAAQGNIIAAGAAGKVKSFLQMTAIVLLLLHDVRFPFLGPAMKCQIIGLYLLLVSIVLSYWGAVEYSLLVLRPKPDQ